MFWYSDLSTWNCDDDIVFIFRSPVPNHCDNTVKPKYHCSWLPHHQEKFKQREGKKSERHQIVQTIVRTVDSCVRLPIVLHNSRPGDKCTARCRGTTAWTLRNGYRMQNRQFFEQWKLFMESLHACPQKYQTIRI